MSMINMTKGNTFHQIGITLCIYYCLWIFHLVYVSKYSKRHVTKCQNYRKKSQTFLLKVILLAILEKQRAKNGEFFFASSSLILIKRLYVCKYGHARERQKRLLGSKKTTKRTSNSTASCWTFSLFFAAFFCWFGLEGGNVFMNPEWGPKQVAKRCQGEGDWTLQLLHITYMCYETWCDVSDGFLTGNLLIVRDWTLEQGHMQQKLCVCACKMS